ncbi:uncharacterized protein BJ212DRAFT_1486175 [Suillus subaureus]|uniref:Uncharacterized protein n=1 Tax=Suillus subaureus TaxID=48587 RepID=A0A9P7DY16_9AGAM|nr:uncharacterized protein BJ212DRAFT_1486175 [Suillus subaureus]KAG1805832.1 hypothetical protein BJ212DRAFT_1486175 [Suillus subaureus]
MKMKAHYVTALELKEVFEADAGVRKEKERIEKEKKEKKKLDEEAHIAHIHNNIATRTFDGPLKSYKQKEDLEALAGALELSRDGKIADLSARIAAHLQDPGTHQSLVENPQLSALYGLKWHGNHGHITASTSTSTESSTWTPSASISLPPAPNNVSPPHMLFFLQIQGSIPYSNYWPGQHHIGAGFSQTAPSPVASMSSQPLPSGHRNNDDSLYYSGNLQYIF